MAKLTVVVGGQYGSEGKGAVVGFLGRTLDERDLVVRVAGPNAGHTAYDSSGKEWKLRCVPVAAVTGAAQLHIGAGSEVDVTVLFDELSQLDANGHNASARLTIHPSATLLEQRHISLEKVSGIVDRIGSTGKGIGEARSERILRNAATCGELRTLSTFMSEPGPLDLDGVRHVIVEGTQGYGLGLHTDAYPQVTSSDCRAIDFLGMAGISPWANNISTFRVIVVARTFPIRVAGNSGPLKGETSWADLGLAEERTTVTNKVRRVGAWDLELLREAVRANGGGDWNNTVQLAITMVDQRFPETRDLALEDWPTANTTAALAFDEQSALAWLETVESELTTQIAYVGTGPNTMTKVTL